MLGRSGVDLRTAQELAGHAKPELTARYSHRRHYDLVGAVDKLPNLVPPSLKAAPAMPLRLTGTDGPNAVARPIAKPFKADKAVQMGVVTGDISMHSIAPMYTPSVFRPASDDAPKTPQNMRPGADLHRAASGCTSEPGGTRTLDQRINLPHGLSPAELLRSGLYHLPRRQAGREPLVKSLRIPAAARARSFLLIAQSGGLSRLARIGRTVPTALRGFQHMERFYRERFGPGTPIEVRCSTN